MKIKTSELTGDALDLAVAKCKGLATHKDAVLNGTTMHGWWISGLFSDPNTWTPLAMFNPSTDWSQGGSIIEREKISLECKHDGWWVASYQYNYVDDKEYLQLSETPLISAMRCYVASKLGDEVEVPDELIGD